MTPKTLIIGACGQIGSELTYKLRERHGINNVIASDINKNNSFLVNHGPFEIINAKDYDAIKECCQKHNIQTIYLHQQQLGKQLQPLFMQVNILFIM